jgi:hypothetical protein
MDLLHLGTFYNNEEVDVVFCEWLRMKGLELCRGGVFKHLPRWEKNASLGSRIMLRKDYNSMK